MTGHTGNTARSITTEEWCLMSLPNIFTVEKEDANRALQAITLGFSTDPVQRWIWPEAAVYLDAKPRFAQASAGKGFDNGTVFAVEGFKAVAMWLAPGVSTDSDAMGAIVAETARPEILEDLINIGISLSEARPTEPHWYLNFIACDPAYLGQGLGSALMKHALQKVDEDGAAAYLESSNPRNMTLYERHGFEAVGKVQHGSSPPLHPMVRPARR